MAGKKKKLMAKSTATYRDEQIYETEKGCTVFLSGKQFDCETLSEATALIDAAYVVAERVVQVVDFTKARLAILN